MHGEVVVEFLGDGEDVVAEVLLELVRGEAEQLLVNVVNIFVD